jgi:hypothetical protein
MVSIAIIHLVHMMPAKATRPEGVTKHTEVTRKAKVTRAVRVINRSTTITLDGKVIQKKRNTSKNQRRKGANTNLTMKRIHTEPSMTSTSTGDTGRSTRNKTNTRRLDIPRYRKAAANNIGDTSHHAQILYLNLETSISCTGTLKIKITKTSNSLNK